MIKNSHNNIKIIKLMKFNLNNNNKIKINKMKIILLILAKI